MARVCVHGMFLNDLVIGIEQCLEGRSLNLGLPLGMRDNLKEETDI